MADYPRKRLLDEEDLNSLSFKDIDDIDDIEIIIPDYEGDITDEDINDIIYGNDDYDDTIHPDPDSILPDYEGDITDEDINDMLK